MLSLYANHRFLLVKLLFKIDMLNYTAAQCTYNFQHVQLCKGNLGQQESCLENVHHHLSYLPKIFVKTIKSFI